MNPIFAGTVEENLSIWKKKICSVFSMSYKSFYSNLRTDKIVKFYLNEIVTFLRNLEF